MDKPEFRVERGPAATDEAFAIGMAKLLEREGRTIAAAELRRLHEANEAFGKRQKWWNEKMFALEQQRGVLLEALQDLCDTLGECGMTEKARAVIKKVQEGD